MRRASKILHENGCWHYACYLAGYVIEAGLKTIIESIGKSKPTYTHDLADLVKHASTVIRSQPSTKIPASVNMQSIASSDLCREWKVEKRYQPSFWDNKEIADNFQKTAQYMISILNSLCSRGLIKQ